MKTSISIRKRLFKTSLASAVVIVTVTGHAADENTPVGVPMTGLGNLSCGEFIKHRRANYKPQMDMYVQYVDGFLASYQFRGNWNTKWVATKPLPRMPEGDEVLLYLERHCTELPLDNVLQGTLALVKDLGGTVAQH